VTGIGSGDRTENRTIEGPQDSAAPRAVAEAHTHADRARDRFQAKADREALIAQLALAETDVLTGARTRAAGLADLDHEIERAHRTTGLLSIAYVDVVGLEALSDSAGHAAGDALLTRAVALIAEHLRSYDLIIRLGGDEFLCVMSNMALSEARERFSHVAAELAATPHCAIRTFFAEITPGESATNLIARADHEFIATSASPH
jgi:diguanylate cyclase (GGDEF)-like protein